MAEEQRKKTSAEYEIKIKGHLDTKWGEWFYDLNIIHQGDGTTTLRGPLPDQAVLHSILDRIRDMNLTLINVQKINNVNQNETVSNGETPSKSEGCVDAN
jgi:hypothetical protein